MSNTTTDQTMEIHIAVADSKISSIVTGQSYNPEIYNDLMVNTMKAYDNALTIAIKHGYAFLINEDDLIDEDDNTEEDPQPDDNE